MSASADRVHVLREEINIHRIYCKCLTTDMINRIYIFIYSGAAGRNTGIREAEHPHCAIRVIAHNHSLTQYCAKIKRYSRNHHKFARHMPFNQHS